MRFRENLGLCPQGPLGEPEPLATLAQAGSGSASEDAPSRGRALQAQAPWGPSGRRALGREAPGPLSPRRGGFGVGSPFPLGPWPDCLGRLGDLRGQCRHRLPLPGAHNPHRLQGGQGHSWAAGCCARRPARRRPRLTLERLEPGEQCREARACRSLWSEDSVNVGVPGGAQVPTGALGRGASLWGAPGAATPGPPAPAPREVKLSEAGASLSLEAGGRTDGRSDGWSDGQAGGGSSRPPPTLPGGRCGSRTGGRACARTAGWTAPSRRRSRPRCCRCGWPRRRRPAA